MSDSPTPNTEGVTESSAASPDMPPDQGDNASGDQISNAPASAPVPSTSNRHQTSTSSSGTSTPTTTQGTAPAPASADPPISTPTQGTPDRVHVQITRPQPTTSQPRGVLQVNPDAGELRLNLGHGNVVNIPLHYHSAYQQHTVNIPSNSGAAATAAAATGTNNAPTNTSNIPVARTTTATTMTTTNIAHTHTHTHTPTPTPTPTHNVNIRVAHLHPLQPQPIHDNNAQTGTASNNSSCDEEALARFKCTLCYEFMSDPVGCPSETCSSRFCFQCLRRAAQESQQASTTHHAASKKPKCPTCRVEFSHMVRDEELKQEMLQGPTVACRHEGCPEQQLKLPLVQEHESHCEFEKVKCRYSSFGCPWIGTRGQISAHEANDCALDKVKVLVDKFRKLEMDHSNRLSIIQQQNVGTMHMLQIYRQNATRDLLKSTTNLFDLLHYCHVITCSTTHFGQTKDRWQSFFRPNEGRAAVTNFLVLLPTVLLCALLNLLGFQSLLIFLFDDRRESQQQRSSVADMALQLLLDDSVVGVLLGMLTMLLLLANFADSKSSVTWGRFPLPGMGSPPVMCDIMAVSVFTMHLGILEFYGAAGKSLVVWILLALTSTIYPAVVLAISHAAARGMTSTPSPTPSNIFGQARSLEPVLLGLRFSLVATYFGVLPTLDAVALCLLINPYLKSNRFSEYLSAKNCFLDSFPKSFLLAFLGAMTAMQTVQSQNWKELDWGELDWSKMIIPDESLLWSVVESAVAFAVLFSATVWLQVFLKVGIWSGLRLARQAEASLSSRPDGSRPSPPDYQLFGLACYGAWAGLMGTLLLVR